MTIGLPVGFFGEHDARVLYSCLGYSWDEIPDDKIAELVFAMHNRRVITISHGDLEMRVSGTTSSVYPDGPSRAVREWEEYIHNRFSQRM